MWLGARRPVGARCSFSVQRAQPGFGGPLCAGKTATTALDSAPQGAAQRERSARPPTLHAWGAYINMGSAAAGARARDSARARGSSACARGSSARARVRPSAVRARASWAGLRASADELARACARLVGMHARLVGTRATTTRRQARVPARTRSRPRDPAVLARARRSSSRAPPSSSRAPPSARVLRLARASSAECAHPRRNAREARPECARALGGTCARGAAEGRADSAEGRATFDGGRARGGSKRAPGPCRTATASRS